MPTTNQPEWTLQHSQLGRTNTHYTPSWAEQTLQQRTRQNKLSNTPSWAEQTPITLLAGQNKHSNNELGRINVPTLLAGQNKHPLHS